MIQQQALFFNEFDLSTFSGMDSYGLFMWIIVLLLNYTGI